MYTRSKGKSTTSPSTSRVQKQAPTIQVVSNEDEDDDEEELDIKENNGRGAMDETIELDGDVDEFDI